MLPNLGSDPDMVKPGAKFHWCKPTVTVRELFRIYTGRKKAVFGSLRTLPKNPCEEMVTNLYLKLILELPIAIQETNFALPDSIVSGE